MRIQHQFPDHVSFINIVDQSIESAPSIKPTQKYCDFTGFKAEYRDYKTGIMYKNSDFYQIITQMTESTKTEYLSFR